VIVTNDILYSYINCQYKAYLKSKEQFGSVSEYQKLYDKLKENQIANFKKLLLKNEKLLYIDNSVTQQFNKEGIALKVNFTNSNIDIVLDGIGFTKEKTCFPIFIAPFEKVTKLDKLFIALQANLIQTYFKLHVECCKIIFGKELRETKFSISTFSKIVKKTINDIAKCLSNSTAPNYFKITHCQICEFQSNCHTKLKERDDLSLLSSMKPKEILRKNNRGIFSVKQLSYLFRPKKNPYKKRSFQPELKAFAIRENKTLIQEMPSLEEIETEIFLDFEGVPDNNLDYLIGVIIRKNNTEKEYSFWANSKEEENSIFIQLIDLLKPLTNFKIYHYGSYEIQVFKKISKSMYSDNHQFINTLIDNSVNLLKIFAYNIYLPTYTNSLKDVAHFLKFEWSDNTSSGLQSIIWRYNWEILNNDELKTKLITYNIEDCRALKNVKDWICNIPKYNNENFENVQNFKRDSIYKWSNEKSIINELIEINSFAYFNYQREKILIKTYPKIAKQQKLRFQQKLKPNKDVKPNKIVQVSRPNECPDCGSLNFSKHEKHKRIITDLKISKSGIRKFITSFNTSRYKCKNCGKNITPKELSVQRKYGRTLCCWIIIQSIQYRNSSYNISKQLKEFFDIHFPHSSVARTKSQFSDFYKLSYNEIVTKVKSSPLVHIDETNIHIKNESCYVWVFTNIDTVFYLFKHTRESEFLKELLAGFKGVLISDFYAGYDALTCPKQRCLIHLIRDLNDDLVKHQLNNELKIIIQNFSSLLKNIMTTINKFGLKKRNLNKHKKEVELFFKTLAKKDFETDICIKWQKRFYSIKNEIFTFLNYDGVPWNNNNAETAVKAVVWYRRDNDGLATKKGIQEYLILLSIRQTCKYRNISFFEFLKSGETSIENYCGKKRGRA